MFDTVYRRRFAAVRCLRILIELEHSEIRTSVESKLAHSRYATGHRYSVNRSAVLERIIGNIGYSAIIGEFYIQKIFAIGKCVLSYARYLAALCEANVFYVLIVKERVIAYFGYICGNGVSSVFRYGHAREFDEFSPFYYLFAGKQYYIAGGGIRFYSFGDSATERYQLVHNSVRQRYFRKLNAAEYGSAQRRYGFRQNDCGYSRRRENRSSYIRKTAIVGKRNARQVGTAAECAFRQCF